MEKILIVDDSLVQATQLKSILENDYEITLVHTAQDGLDYASSGSYSLILLDVVMPDMNGFTLLKTLQEEVITRHIPVILITSLADIEHEQLGLTLGAVDYIVKPFHPLIVKARVNTHIKLYRYRRQIEALSVTDPLTGVANRRRHDRYSIIKWQEATRLQIPFSVCMFYIDKFMVYNDTFGHPAGDTVITSVAKTVASHLRRSTDFFARYGGEEFVAFLVGDSAEKAFNHLKRVRQAVEDLHIPHNPEVSPWVTISIGGATMIPRRDSTYDSCLKMADAMLYDAKKLGRNRVVWVSDAMKQWREERSDS